VVVDRHAERSRTVHLAAAPSIWPPTELDNTSTAAGQFSTLLAAVDAAGLTSTLRSNGPFTVFAPTDAAFAAVPQATLNALLADPAALAAVLGYHVVPGLVEASQAVTLTSAQTVNGKPLPITFTNGVVRVDGVRVVATDVRASSGIIHVIDAVLIP
jgi:transforming growth factor-beta-induced protein